ncbi:TPA: hypothetical protein U1079_002045 [Streptococcus suis]|nr:hypothetical protein [Streptococcus suis]
MDEKFEENVNKGFMKVTMCYIILQMLQDERLKDINFELNLVNTANFYTKNGTKTAPEIYKVFLNDFDPEDKREEFRIFLALNRENDLDYFRNLYEFIIQDKGVEVI